MSPSPDVQLSIVLPVRSRGMNLPILLKILGAVLEIPYEVLVITTRPEDVPLQNARLRVIPNESGHVVDGIKKGVAESAGDYILIFAADEVGPVLAINDMLALAESGCDFVSCTRYAHGGRRLGGSLIGGTLSRWANALFRRFSGCALTDATTGIKLFRRDVFEQLDLQAKSIGWTVAFEMSIKAQLAGMQLGEVPIISIDRLYGGISTFSLRTWIPAYLRWFIWGIVQLRRMPPQGAAVRIPTAASLIGINETGE